MEIRFQRMHTHQNETDECCVCGQWFKFQSVAALVVVPGAMQDGRVCFECLEVLHRRACDAGNGDRFPTVECYRELLRQYPHPLWPDPESAEFTELHDPDEYGRMCEESGIEWRG